MPPAWKSWVILSGLAQAWLFSSQLTVPCNPSWAGLIRPFTAPKPWAGADWKYTTKRQMTGLARQYGPHQPRKAVRLRLQQAVQRHILQKHDGFGVVDVAMGHHLQGFS